MMTMTTRIMPTMAPGDKPVWAVEDGQVYVHEFPEHVNLIGKPGSCARRDALFAVIK